MGRDGEKPPKERRRRAARRGARRTDEKGQKRSHRTAPNPGRVSKPKGKPKASGPVTPSRAVRAPKKKKKTQSAAKTGPKKTTTSSRRAGRTPRTPGLTREVQESAATIAPEIQKAVDEFMIRALAQAEKTLKALERESRNDRPSPTREHARARKEIFAEATHRLRELRGDLERRRVNLTPPQEP